jgi:hypothetical protein
VDNDTQNIPAPVEWPESELYAILYNTWIRHLSPEYKAAGAADKGALNVNAWDEVPNSSWFTNRIGRRPMKFQEIVDGLEGKPPQPGPWKIQRNSNEGYTPKFIIQDSGGQRYVLKFDPSTAIERNSGAERIGTLIMHAAGYNVPHNTIAYFTRETLVSDEKSQYEDAIGKRRALRPEDIENTFAKLKTMADGRYRALASFYIPGLQPVGRFFYSGTRKDDPNDLIPHELRRELRGLGVIASWINHVDVGDKNAQDMYVEVDGRKFVKHYFLDFGSTMGSGDFVNGPFRVGNEYIFDSHAMVRSFATLGIWRRPWEVNQSIRYPEIGYFQAELFEPENWKPNYPNLAFERMDDGDGYWGAKIVTAFNDELVAGLARSGEYSREEVTPYLESVLKRRRDAIGNYWLNRVTPLEEITIINSESGSRLQFRDLAVERGYANRNSRSYRFSVESLTGVKIVKDQISGELEIRNLADIVAKTSQETFDTYGRAPSVRILIQSNQPDGKWAVPTEVFVGRTRDNLIPQVLGWTHAPKK